MNDEEIPLRRLWKYRALLNDAVDEGDWDEARRLSELIVSDIPVALSPSKCGTGSPHLDGLYSIGTMRYTSAPHKTKRSLNKMNRILKTAKNNIPRKGK